MAERNFRIPRVALAVLVLGGACGDDEPDSDESSDAGSRDAGHGHDAGDDHEHDAGSEPEHDAGDGHEHDAGGGGADAGGGNDVDISDTRIQRVAADFCEQGFACDVEEVVGNFDDEASCIADSVMYWHDYVETLGEDCIDAQLDLYACAALLSCGDDVEHHCGEQIETTGDLCAEDG